MGKKKGEATVDEGNTTQAVENPAPVETKTPVPTKAELAQKEADAVEFTDDVFYEEGRTEWPTISRAAAILKGFRRYFTGETCANGHVAPRKTKSAACVVCTRDRLKMRKKIRMKDDPDYKAAQYEKAKARRQRKAAEKKASAPPTVDAEKTQSA